jgi:lipopolysaccharide export system protein LptA
VAPRLPSFFMHGAAGLAVALLLCPAARVQAQLLGGDDGQPVEIQADSGIEWQQNAQIYIARGNAVAKRGASELHADTIIAHYRPIKAGGAAANAAPGNALGTGGNTEIYRVDAEGNVTIKRDAQTVVGDHAVYDVDQALAVITGKALKLTTPTDLVTARDSLEWYDQKQVAVARGDAVASRNGKTIKADILTAYMVKTAPAGSAKAQPVSAKPGTPPSPGAAQESKISRVDGQGHVVVTNATDTGRGDFAVYNAVTGISTLVGHVVIARAKDVIHGESAVMDMNNNVSRILPTAGTPGAPRQRVQGLFVREDGGRAGAGGKPGAAPGKAP